MFDQLTFTWISGVYADKGVRKPSAESIVTCQTAGPQIYAVVAISLPAAINAEHCVTPPDEFPPAECAPCIISLEDQGCKVADVDTAMSGMYKEFQIVTYLLSCIKPQPHAAGW